MSPPTADCQRNFNLQSAAANSPCKVEFVYYDIHGQDGTELREAMNQNGPFDHSGVRRDAFTAWYIHWNWPSTDGKPDFRKARSFCDVTITLPRWEPGDGVNSGLVNKWEEFIQRLEQHEARHLGFASQIYPKIPEAVKKAARKNRDLDSQQANDIAQEFLTRLRRMDREYDSETGNGRLEGVRFP